MSWGWKSSSPPWPINYDSVRCVWYRRYFGCFKTPSSLLRDWSSVGGLPASLVVSDNLPSCRNLLTPSKLRFNSPIYARLFQVLQLEITFYRHRWRRCANKCKVLASLHTRKRYLYGLVAFWGYYLLCHRALRLFINEFKRFWLAQDIILQAIPSGTTDSLPGHVKSNGSMILLQK